MPESGRAPRKNTKGNDRLKVLLAIHDVELAIQTVELLEEAGHVAEHVFDMAEALLRARVALADVLVLDLVMPRVDHSLLRNWADQGTIPLVLLSTSAAGERLARRLGATFFERPAHPKRKSDPPSEPIRERRDTVPVVGWASAFVDVVETAAKRSSSSDDPTELIQARKRSGTTAAAPLVLVAATGRNLREVVASFLQSQLGLRCEMAPDAASALEILRGSATETAPAKRRVRAVVMEGSLILLPQGDELTEAISQAGIPMVPLRVGSDDDAASAGRAAWDAAPALRAALAAARSRTA